MQKINQKLTLYRFFIVRNKHRAGVGQGRGEECVVKLHGNSLFIFIMG
jgi:hypothetical protein